MYSGLDAKLTVDLRDNDECFVFAMLKNPVSKPKSAQCIYRVNGSRITLVWTGPAASRGPEPLELILSSDAMVMHFEGEPHRLLRSTRAAPMTLVPGQRALNDRELRARWETFLACEGAHVDGMRLSPHDTRLEIEITSPKAWEGSKVYVDSGNGAVRWEHSRKPECGRPLDLEPI